MTILRNISSFLHQISKTWVMVLTLGSMVLFMVFVLPNKAASSQAATGSTGSPDTSFFYRPSQLSAWAEEFGPSGRQSYIYDRWTFDLIFPLVYVGFLAVGISWILKRIQAASAVIMLANLLPLAAGIFDILENSCTSVFMGIYPDLIPGLAFLAAVCSGVKWIFVFAAFLAYFILAAAAVYQKLKPNRI